MSFTLDTSAKIIKHVKGLSSFIKDVKIVGVYPAGFYFRVKVPIWYKFFLSKLLYKKIKEELKARMLLGIEFEFEIYSEKFF